MADLARPEMLGGPSRVEVLFATYFDTLGRILDRNGISFRIRKSGEHLVQTIKSDGQSSSGLFTRSERELEVETIEPALSRDDPVYALLESSGSKLHPMFSTDVRRSTWLFVNADCVIELVCDCGFISADDRKCAISEMELELRSGPRACVFKKAAELAQLLPVRLGVLTKPERGWMLREPERTCFKADKLLMDQGSRTADAFRQVCWHCIRLYRINEDLLLAGQGSEALHQARVAIRRLRAAMSSFRKLVAGDPQATDLKQELRWLAAQLGMVRDIDVLLERANSVSIRINLHDQRTKAYESLCRALDSSRARILFLNLAGWLSEGAWLHLHATEKLRARPIRKLAVAALERLHRKVERAGATLFEPDNDEGRHALRKDAKKLRYASEFFASQFQAAKQKCRYKKFLSTLEDLQDHLGQLNDRATTLALIRQMDIQGGLASFEGGDSTSKEALIASAQSAHAALMKTKPFWEAK